MRHLAIYLPSGPLGLNGEREKFNLANTLTARAGHLLGIRPVRKALTMQGRLSIRPAMAAGAILPPMFFERYRLVSLFAPAWHFRRTSGNNTSAIQRPAHSGGPSATSSLPKEI
jgi:hypothetical protein